MAQSRTRSKCKSITLFGGEEDWDEADWKAQDDSVRGGNSKSHLDVDDGKARFHGNLDIETLGGAGFASQRTAAEEQIWDLSDFAGIQLEIAKGDKNRYTFIVKDDIPEPGATNGRDRSTISWEVDFELPPQDKPDEVHDKTIFMPWEAFNPTYRGKIQKDADPLDKKQIKRFSIMIRSFFGAQDGDFSLSVRSIKAVCEAPPPGDDATNRNSTSKVLDTHQLSQLEEGSSTHGRAEMDQQKNAYYSLAGGLPGGVLAGKLQIHRHTAHVLIGGALIFALYHYFCRRTTSRLS